MKCTCGEAVRFPDERSEEPCEARSQEGARARQNHAGGVPANCGSGEQVGRRPRLSIVAGEVLFEKWRKALLEPGNDLPPIAELEVFTNGPRLSGFDAILAL